jgi:3-hydroxyisobutyrate dehydrogenase-like beta-hydroxyacid dehydrogenase
MASIAFLGTGLLGSGFAEAALGRGDQVTVWNRTPSKAQALATHGARVADTPAAAVRDAVRVHLVLQDDASVDEVVAALRPGLGADTIIIDHTTTLPAQTAERVRRLNAEGVRYLHCPVFIGPAAARDSEGIILASGPQALFGEVRDALGRQATRVEYFGERPDLAAVYKLCGNALILGITGLVADVFTVAHGAEVTPMDALKLLEFFNPAGIVAGRGKRMSAGDFTPGFELTMARKDLRLMIETAKLPLAALPGIAARMDTLIAEGHGGADIGVLGVDAVT